MDSRIQQQCAQPLRTRHTGLGVADDGQRLNSLPERPSATLRYEEGGGVAAQLDYLMLVRLRGWMRRKVTGLVVVTALGVGAAVGWLAQTCSSCM